MFWCRRGEDRTTIFTEIDHSVQLHFCLFLQPASTDGHFAGTDFDPRSYLCVRSGLLKVPTTKHHPNSNTNPNVSVPFGSQEASRCASAAGVYANSPFNSNSSNNNLHTRHASSSAAYLRSHVMLAPPNDGNGNNGGGGGGGGGIGSYLSDSDLNSNMHHTGSVSSSPGLRTKSISPTTSAHNVFAHSRPLHQMIPHLQAPGAHPPPPPPPHPSLLFCPQDPVTTTTTGGSDFLPMSSSEADLPLRLSRSPAMNYSTSGVDGPPSTSSWGGGGGGGNQQRPTGGSVLAPVMDDYPQHTPSSPLYISMRDNVGDGGSNDPGSVQACGRGTGDSFQSRSGKSHSFTHQVSVLGVERKRTILSHLFLMFCCILSKFTISSFIYPFAGRQSFEAFLTGTNEFYTLWCFLYLLLFYFLFVTDVKFPIKNVIASKERKEKVLFLIPIFPPPQTNAHFLSLTFGSVCSTH